MFFMISKAWSGPPNPASASATSGANQCVDSSSFMCAISSARLRALLRRRSRAGTESEGYRLWSGYISSALFASRSEEHTSELQSHSDLVCRLLLEKKKESEAHPAARPHRPA